MVVGFLAMLGALSIWSGSDSQDVPPHDASAAQFITAWERYRTGTFVLSGSFTRDTGQGELTSEYVMAQRPPQRTLFQFGGLDSIGGDPTVCTTDGDGEELCAPAAAVEPYDEAVEEEIDALRTYFFGNDPPLYQVLEHEDGCFELLLRREMPLAPYGFSTRFCFDEATGGLEEMIQQREGGIDHLVIEEIRTDVGDGDLAPVLADEGDASEP